MPSQTRQFTLTPDTYVPIAAGVASCRITPLGVGAFRLHVGAAMGATEAHVFPNPLRSTANAALNLACLTAGAQVHVDAQGYTAA